MPADGFGVHRDSCFPASEFADLQDLVLGHRPSSALTNCRFRVSARSVRVAHRPVSLISRLHYGY
jgi:hypothetical protein